MFSNLFKSILVQQTIQTNVKRVSLLRLMSSNAAEKKSDEIKAALDIEANLFDNSAIQHAPVAVKDVLRRHGKHTNTKTKSNTLIHANSNSSSTLIAHKKAPQTTRKETSKIINDAELGLEFVRLQLNDSQLNTLMTTVRSRKQRDKNAQIIIEGRRLIDEALTCGLHMHALIFSQREQLALISKEVGKAQRKNGAKIYKVPQHDLKTWSTLTTPPGLLAIFQRPTAKDIELQQDAMPLPITVVCDNIREPNNLGSIIRTCAALPCQQVVLTRGCCDPWETKALRGACGAHFRLPIRDDVDWSDLALVIPPEAADDCHVFIAESNRGKRQQLAQSIEMLDYAALQRTGAHNVLIIGGESHGVSAEAYKFMQLVGERGKCVYIPLAAGIESLNVNSALTLILFELRKKLNSAAETR